MQGIILRPGTWAYPLAPFEHDADGRPLTLADICTRLDKQLALINKGGGKVRGMLRVNALDEGRSASGIGNQHVGVIIIVEKY